jgi:hypothetical protein
MELTITRRLIIGMAGPISLFHNHGVACTLHCSPRTHYAIDIGIGTELGPEDNLPGIWNAKANDDDWEQGIFEKCRDPTLRIPDFMISIRNL